MSVFVIAEIGSAWVWTEDWTANQRNAWQAILIAKQAGCDAVKFQFTSNRSYMAARRKVEDASAYWQLWWREAWLADFFERANKIGIEFMCTAFLPQDVAKVAPFVKRFKVASLEAHDPALWRAIRKHNKPVIVSSGCCDADLLYGMPWWSEPAAKILHCTAAYPCPPEELNLRAMEEFDGLSDHTANVLTGALATVAGAEIIEVHFRLDHTPKDNPDFPHSLTPQKLAQYIKNIRTAELMMGDGIKKVMPGEEALRQHKVNA